MNKQSGIYKLKNPIYLTMFAALVAMSLFVLFIYYPTQQQLATAHSEWLEKKGQITELQGLLQQEVAATALEPMDQWVQGVPVEEGMDTFLLSLEQLAQEHLIRLDGITILTHQVATAQSSEEIANSFPQHLTEVHTERSLPMDKLELKYTQLEIVIQGKEQDIVSFMDRLTQLPRIVHVNSMQVQAIELDSELARVEWAADLTLTIYYIEQFAPFMR